MQARSVGLTAASLARLLALNPSEVPLVIGSTLITGGTDTRVLFDDGGKLGESAGFTYTKASGLLASTAMAIGGAAIGPNALAVGGTANISGVLTTAGITNSGSADLIWGNGFIRSSGASKMDLSVNSAVAFTSNSNAIIFSVSTTVANFNTAAITAGAATFSGVLKINNARAAGIVAQGGTVTIQDSAGTTIQLLCA